MFKPMRRVQREIPVEAAKDVLKRARRGVLAMNGEDGYPYAVPLNYLYDEEANKIYFHGARAGQKYELLQRDERVCFTVNGEPTIKAEEWAPFVQSAIVFGRCHLVEVGDRAVELLTNFAMKYYPSAEMVHNSVAGGAKVTQMFEITIEHISGKEIQEK